MTTRIQRALLSVSDKQGVVAFAAALHERGVALLSTGGTARAISEAGIPVTQVSEYTGAPEIMDGRVKTLHPKIHGGILARRGIDDEVMAEQGITGIDLVCVNLYPFRQTLANPDASRQDIVENIDIGGPCMLRAAAKNHAFVTVVVDSDDYAAVLADIDAHNGAVSDDLRRRLAGKGFAHTAGYDAAIANWLGSEAQPFPDALSLQLHKAQDLRYGENPHQQAAFYRWPESATGCIASCHQLQGKDLSFNNIADTDAALETVKLFDEAPACVIVKHANPCGVALGKDLQQAYERAFATDSTSAFGGIIAFNRRLDAATARAIVDRQFAEVIVAPEVADEALQIFAEKKNLRVLSCGEFSDTGNAGEAKEIRSVAGGVLVQSFDRDITAREPEDAGETRATEQQRQDLLFAWRVAKQVKSNAIVYARDGQTLGIGAGQMSRIDSARIAVRKAQDAGLDIQGAVMASDAFFPFRDGIDAAAEAGIAAVIQPGGSMRDDEVIAAANEHGMAMLFTGMRHFKH